MRALLEGIVCWLFMLAAVVGVLLFWMHDFGLLTMIFGMGL